MIDTSIQIKNVVVHLLRKDQHREAILELGRKEGNMTEASQRLISHICERYKGRAGKGYGCFEKDTDNYPMGKIINAYYSCRENDFYECSCRMAQHLFVRSNEQQLATGGYILITHIQNNNHEYLLVAIINSTTGSIVTPDFLIKDSKYLDIEKLRVAGRIDLTAWKNGAERYISFLKGQTLVSSYFKKFLGCNDILIAKIETEKLKKALISFIEERDLSKEEKNDFLENAYTILRDHSKKDNPIELNTIINTLWPSDPDLLREKICQEEYELSDGFVPDGRIIKSLVSFKGKSEHWELKFERVAIAEGSVRYDKEHDVLVLSQIPDALKEELIREGL